MQFILRVPNLRDAVFRPLLAPNYSRQLRKMLPLCEEKNIHDPKPLIQNVDKVQLVFLKMY